MASELWFLLMKREESFADWIVPVGSTGCTGNRLPHESTSGLALCGSPVSRECLQPGDIIIRTGEDAHVIMFLEWTEDGSIRCIHESSANINNVTVGVRDANWPYYRKLID